MSCYSNNNYRYFALVACPLIVLAAAICYHLLILDCFTPSLSRFFKWAVASSMIMCTLAFQEPLPDVSRHFSKISSWLETLFEPRTNQKVTVSENVISTFWVLNPAVITRCQCNIPVLVSIMPNLKCAGVCFTVPVALVEHFSLICQTNLICLSIEGDQRFPDEAIHATEKHFTQEKVVGRLVQWQGKGIHRQQSGPVGSGQWNRKRR